MEELKVMETFENFWWRCNYIEAAFKCFLISDQIQCIISRGFLLKQPSRHTNPLLVVCSGIIIFIPEKAIYEFESTMDGMGLNAGFLGVVSGELHGL